MSSVGGIYLIVSIHQMSVDKGLFHLRVEGFAFHRTPSALAQKTIVGHGPFLLRIYQYQVGLIARTDETTSFYLIQSCRCMAHLLNQLFDAELSLVYQFHDGSQGELQGRHTRYSFQCTALLFAQEVRSVVGTDDINQVASQGLAQGIAVGLRLDGRITLDACSKFVIVFITEEQVRHAGFCRCRTSGSFRR